MERLDDSIRGWVCRICARPVSTTATDSVKVPTGWCHGACLRHAIAKHEETADA